MSGTGHSTTTVQATGDQEIDGILSSRAWSSAETLYYSVPTNASEYSGSYGAGEDAGFYMATAAMEATLDFALAADYGNSANDGFSVEGFTGLNVQQTTNANAQIRMAQTTSDPYNYGTAWGYYPSTWNAGGDVWFTPIKADYTAPVHGNYAHMAILHEIGHALGLKHGMDSDTYGALPSEWDAMEFTVMTYRSYVGASASGYKNETWGYAQSWMMLDIAALQYMYGADFTTNAGDTVYSWTPGSGNTLVNGVAAITPGENRIFATIWDGGGEDTYDLSAYTTDLFVDLEPGKSSLFTTTQQAHLGNGNYASGNIYNALQYQGDVRSLIENATGGNGNDELRGNSANNALTGGNGNDRLVGLSGNDTLTGGTGRDVLMGGTGDDVMTGGDGNDFFNAGGHDDTVDGGAGRDRIYGYAGADTLRGGDDVDLINGGYGNDTLYGDGGADRLEGDFGDDILIGGAGGDRLIGQQGSDTFRFLSVSDSPTGALNDKIQDFEIGIDKIDLSQMSSSGIDLNIGGGFAGNGACAITSEVGADTRIFVDIDGDKVADFRIILENAQGLTASDFIL